MRRNMQYNFLQSNSTRANNNTSKSYPFGLVDFYFAEELPTRNYIFQMFVILL